MPIYEYQCDACGPFELMRKVSDPTLRRCPTCKGKVTKLISNSSFQLKGTGWYVTDYARKDGGNKTAKTDSGEPSKTESAATTESTTATATPAKTDTSSKPAAKPKPKEATAA